MTPICNEQHRCARSLAPMWHHTYRTIDSLLMQPAGEALRAVMVQDEKFNCQVLRRPFFSVQHFLHWHDMNGAAKGMAEQDKASYSSTQPRCNRLV